MNRSEKIEQVTASLFAVHRDLENPPKDAKGQVRGKVDYRYLSLPALTAYLRPILREYQLFCTQEVAGGENFVTVFTTVWHLSGQHIEFGPAFMPATGDAQQVGSAITYARRYALAAVFNLAADEDDDAKAAGVGKLPASPPAREPAVTLGEGVTAGSLNPGDYLNPEEIRALCDRLAIGKAQLLQLARTRFGERIRAVTDITHDMGRELEP